MENLTAPVHHKYSCVL